MNKQELITRMAEKAGLSKKDAEAALSAAIEVVIEAMKAGDEVRLIGFGTFSAPMREARTVRIPGTNETKQLPAMRVPKFKPGKGLKEAVN